MLGFNYGTNLAVFPAACKDYFGSATSASTTAASSPPLAPPASIMPWVNGLIEDRTGSSDLSYAIIIGLLVCAVVLAVVSKLVGQPGARRGGVLISEEGTG